MLHKCDDIFSESERGTTSICAERASEWQEPEPEVPLYLAYIERLFLLASE